jgi:hypothetical protein
MGTAFPDARAPIHEERQVPPGPRWNRRRLSVIKVYGYQELEPLLGDHFFIGFTFDR